MVFFFFFFLENAKTRLAFQKSPPTKIDPTRPHSESGGPIDKEREGEGGELDLLNIINKPISSQVLFPSTRH